MRQQLLLTLAVSASSFLLLGGCSLSLSTANTDGGVPEESGDGGVPGDWLDGTAPGVGRDGSAPGADASVPGRDGGWSGDAGDQSSDGGVPDDASFDAGPDDGSFLTIRGSFNALPLDFVNGTVFFVAPDPKEVGVKSRMIAVFSNKPNLCTTGPFRENETVLALDALSGDTSFGPGTYTFTANDLPGEVDINLSKLSATCTSVGQDYGTLSGTLVVTKVSPAEVSGTFQVVLTSGAGTLEGSFHVPTCDPPPTTDCQP
jgi:hypothetical protein